MAQQKMASYQNLASQEMTFDIPIQKRHQYIMNN